MRADGKRLKDINPIDLVACHIMADRNDACNSIELDIPLQPMNDYIRKKHKEGINVSHASLFLTAYLHAAAQYPKINRFVVNKKIYARNEFCVSMVVLKPGSEDGTINKMYFDYTDTIFDVTKTFDDYVRKNRMNGDTNSTDGVAGAFVKIPGLLRGGINFVKFLDKHGWMPYRLIQASPFHSTMVLTNLASIRTNHIFHHVYNFGTTGMIISMGNPREVPTRTANGVEFVRCLPLGAVMDERLCNGCYYAHFFQAIRHYLKYPELLEQPPETVVYEVPFRGKESHKKR